MAYDRILVCKHKKKWPLPNIDDVYTVLKNYIGDAGKCSKDNESYLLVVLPGKPTFPFRHVYPNRQLAMDDLDGRYLEVFVGNDGPDAHISVQTRQADDFTNAVAEGFAKTLQLYYHLKREPN